MNASYNKISVVWHQIDLSNCYYKIGYLLREHTSIFTRLMVITSPSVKEAQLDFLSPLTSNGMIRLEQRPIGCDHAPPMLYL